MRVATVPLDLSSQQSVRAAAAEVARLTDRLDVLVNNAAVMVTSRRATPEGIEMQFGTNHVGPFLLTNLLLPLLRRAASDTKPGATRVVSLTSAGHRLSPVRFSDHNLTLADDDPALPPDEDHVRPLSGAFGRSTADGYNGIVAYAQSKTANILFTLYLQQHLAKHGIAAYVLHPGCKLPFPTSLFLITASRAGKIVLTRRSDRDGARQGPGRRAQCAVFKGSAVLENARRRLVDHTGRRCRPRPER